MESGNPVVPEPLQQLIKAQAALLGEDGDAIIQDIQEEAEKDGKLPADIFKLIESCRMDLGKRVALQELSNEMIRAREPERLVQVEAIREQVTRYNGARAGGDNEALKEAGLTLKRLVGKYMTDVGKDEEDRLAPDTAQMWKDQVYEILRGAPHFPDGATGGDPAHIASSAPAALEPPDGLAPLRLAIRLAAHTMEAVVREIQDPDQTTLRGLGKHLGNSKKEIMALSRSLIVGQSASVATEATRLADEASEAIKSNRESIRAALRGLGVASDISEASGPTRAQGLPPARPAVGNLDLDWTAPGWLPAHTPATTAWPPMEPMPRPRIKGAGEELSTLMRGMMNAQANDSGWPTFSGKYVEYPRIHKEWWAYADVPWARARRAGVPQPQGAEPGQPRPAAGERHRPPEGSVGHAGHVLRPAGEVHPRGFGPRHQVQKLQGVRQWSYPRILLHPQGNHDGGQESGAAQASD